ncbi:MAG TPA: DMT family transporter [Acidimicrobiales bacterium]|nr:DMT family transporter [Acidimicrobiales bacterium]
MQATAAGQARGGSHLERRGPGLGGANPVIAALLGAACISSSAVLVQLAHGAPGTTAFFRCALALPGLYALAWGERRRFRPLGRRPVKPRVLAALAGVLLGVDLVLWTSAIYDVGAGIATVLGNLQVLFVTAIAWFVLRERPRPRFLAALPVVLLGVALVSGLIGHSSIGHRPLAGTLYGLGTSLAYALFILVMRTASATPALSPMVAGPLADASAGAALAALVLGIALGQLDLTPPLRALGWYLLLALLSQTLGWLLITSSLPHLPAAHSSLLLLLQPAAALVLAAAVLGQRPTLVQLLGAGLVCGGVLAAARSAGRVRAGGTSRRERAGEKW